MVSVFSDWTKGKIQSRWSCVPWRRPSNFSPILPPNFTWKIPCQVSSFLATLHRYKFLFPSYLVGLLTSVQPLDVEQWLFLMEIWKPRKAFKIQSISCIVLVCPHIVLSLCCTASNVAHNLPYLTLCLSIVLIYLGKIFSESAFFNKIVLIYQTHPPSYMLTVPLHRPCRLLVPASPPFPTEAADTPGFWVWPGSSTFSGTLVMLSL